MSTASEATQAGHVIAKLGGITATARLLGHKNPTTVQGWMERGFIPGHRQSEVLDAALAAGLELSADDFVVHLRKEPEPAEPRSAA